MADTAPRPWYSVRAAGNDTTELFIYGDIGSNWWGEESVTAKSLVKELQDITSDYITVRLNSYGGAVADGIAIYNALQRHKAAVTIEIDAVAYSIASLIAMAGDTVRMSANALMMVHAPWGATAGNAAHMRKYAEVLDQHAAAMAASYTARGISRETVDGWLTDGEDHYFTADEARDAGLVDEISDALDLAASLRGLDLGVFRNPAAAAAKQPKEATMPNHTTAAQPQPADLNVVEIEKAAAARALKADQDRRAGIRAAFAPFLGAVPGASEAMASALDDLECTADQAHSRITALWERGLAGQTPGEGDGAGHVGAGADQRDKLKTGVMAVIAARAGLHEKGKRPDLTGNEFSGFSLVEIARACLARAGIDSRGMDKMTMVGRAFAAHTTSDFAYILENSAEKAMLMGYSEAPETFGLWTRAGNLSDFKTTSRVGLSEFSDLDLVPESAEYKNGSVGDRREQIALGTYGKLFNVSRQAIINDDLGAFTTIPRKMGTAAARKVGDLAWGVLTVNAAMADGTALFHADHSNLGSGTITAANVGAGRTAMGIQTDSSGNAVLNIEPAYFLVPRALRDTAEVLMMAETNPTSTNSRVPNPVRNMAQVVSDARLDSSSAIIWYLAADPNRFDTVEVAYLDGNPNPYLESKDDWTVDGVSFKVRIDAAAKALDHRAMYKSTGA